VKCQSRNLFPATSVFQGPPKSHYCLVFYLLCEFLCDVPRSETGLTVSIFISSLCNANRYLHSRFPLPISVTVKINAWMLPFTSEVTMCTTYFNVQYLLIFPTQIYEFFYGVNLKVKVKLSLCFNWTLRHEGVLGSGDTAPCIL